MKTIILHSDCKKTRSLVRKLQDDCYQIKNNEVIVVFLQRLHKPYLLTLITMLVCLNLSGQKGIGMAHGTSNINGAGIPYTGVNQTEVGYIYSKTNPGVILESTWLFKEFTSIRSSLTYNGSFRYIHFPLQAVFLEDDNELVLINDTRDHLFLNLGLGMQTRVSPHVFIGLSSSIGTSTFLANRSYVYGYQNHTTNGTRIMLIDNDDEIALDYALDTGNTGKKAIVVYNISTNLYAGYQYQVNKAKTNQHPGKKETYLYGKISLSHFYYQWLSIKSNSFPITFAIGIKM